MTPSLPMTPGREVAGVVDQVGGGVDETIIGHRVVADLGPASGGYAELAAARAASLHEIPVNVDADQAAAMVGTGRTSMAILELARPTGEDTVLITAGAGGVGSLLVQPRGQLALQSLPPPADQRRHSPPANSVPRLLPTTSAMAG